jgi:hypothetical protein
VPTEAPPGIGFHMPVGAKVIMAYHYHPTGRGDEIDQSSIALRWTEEEPETKAFMGVLGAIFSGDGVDPGPNDPNGVPVFEIPPNVAGHTETLTYQLPDILPPIPLFTMGTHMHYIGVDMKISVTRDGEEQCWIQTPRWDFNWQRLYDVDAPLEDMPHVQGGDIVTLRCTYDNTLDNPDVAAALGEVGLDEPQDVQLGEGTLDEMCLAGIGVGVKGLP